MDGTILVADDDRTIRTVLTQALTRAGCKVHATSSLTTLMRWVAEGKGDVVISDVMMPELSGTELCRAIKGDAETRRIPVVLVTSKAEREMKIEGLELGVDYGMTHSCYDPGHAGRPCTRCDACLLRQRAFEHLGLKDPLLKL